MSYRTYQDFVPDMVAYSKSLLGVAYRWGGDDPIGGFDCSGLVIEILSAIGAEPPCDMTAHQLFAHFRQYSVSVPPQAGALAFYGSVSKVTHVAFCISSHLVIEAGGGGPSTTSADAAAKQNAFVRMRPIDHRGDKMATLLPDMTV